MYTILGLVCIGFVIGYLAAMETWWAVILLVAAQLCIILAEAFDDWQLIQYAI